MGWIYDIRVLREKPGNRVSIRIDGNAIEGNLIPLPAPNCKKLQVEVTLG